MDSSFVLSIILIAFGILFIPFISRMIRVPVSVGEILYGMVIGKSLLRLVHESQWLGFLSSFGFLLLMFLSGLEVNFSRIKSLPLREKSVVILFPVITFTVATILGHLFGLSSIESIAVGVISVGVVVAVLRENRILNSKLGRITFLTGISGEIVSIAVLTVFSILFKFGFGVKSIVSFLEIVIYLLLARILLSVLRSIVWWYPNRMRFYFEKSPSEMGARLSLAVMFILSAAATTINVEPILGAFLAGLIFSSTFRDVEIVEEKLTGIGFGFLIPIFFMYVGIKFNPPGIDLGFVKLVFTVVAMSYVSKLLPSILLKFAGISLRDAVSSGFLLSAPLTLVVVTAEFGRSMGALSEYQESALIFAAVLMGIVSPIVFNNMRRG